VFAPLRVVGAFTVAPRAVGVLVVKHPVTTAARLRRPHHRDSVTENPYRMWLSEFVWSKTVRRQPARRWRVEVTPPER